MGAWSRRQRLRRFAEANIPEIGLVAFGIMLRVSMSWGFDANWGYDAADHAKIINWFVAHSELPLVSYGRCAYHPPLYYAFAALFRAHGVSLQGVQWISILSGSLRLPLIWIACLRALPEARLARIAALALAAVIPASVHLDGMVSNEGLANLLAMSALALVPPMFLSPRRWPASLAVGALVGLELLTKVSALAMVGAIGAALAIELVLRRAEWRRVAPALAGALTLAAVAGWYCVHNQRLYGKPFLASFDGPDRASAVEGLKKPYWLRRAPGFVFGWSNDIYSSPYYPSGVWPESHLFPALIASTFSDAFNYGYAPPPAATAPQLVGSYKPLRPEALDLARYSVMGGSAIALAVTIAWFAAVAWCWRRRRFELLALALAPFFGVLGQFHFATKYPVDAMGPVKGVYMQFAAPPLYVLYGVAIAWLWRRRRARALAIALGLALVPVAAYTIYCRLLAR